MTKPDIELAQEIKALAQKWPHPYSLILGDGDGGHTATAWGDTVRDEIEVSRALLHHVGQQLGASDADFYVTEDKAELTG